MSPMCIYLIVALLSVVFAQSDINNPNWRLAWSDEFNGNSLDTTKWTARNMQGNGGNGELEWYSPSQISVANGYAVITANNISTGGMPYVSGRMDTQDLASFTFARFTTRAKMAGGPGMWPAIWLLSDTTCWPVGIEYDLMEYRGSYPTQYAMNYHYSGSNTCCAPGVSNCVNYYGHTYSGSEDLSQDFHNYTMDLWPTNFTYYFDGVPQWTVQTGGNNPIPASPTPHYWIINSAVGGGYPGNPTSQTVFPNYLVVDYVRVYEWEPSCSAYTCSNQGCCNANDVCVCNTGYDGTYCEQFIGSATHTFADLDSLDLCINGWGTYALYMNEWCQLNNGLTLTISNSGCPGNCGGLGYGAGAWQSENMYGYGSFTWIAKGAAISGTALSLTASGNYGGMQQQITWSLAGVNHTSVELITWANNYQYLHAIIPLGFDFSRAYHNYTCVFLSTGISWYVDNHLKYSDSKNIPFGELNIGAYFTANPQWYGPFNYNGPYTTSLTSSSWRTAGGKATC